MATTTPKIKLTDRQASIKAALDRGDSVAEISRSLGISRAAVYNAAARLAKLNPNWKPKTAIGKRSSGRKVAKAAAPRKTDPLDALRTSITRQRETLIAERDNLNDEIERLAAAEKALA